MPPAGSAAWLWLVRKGDTSQRPCTAVFCPRSVSEHCKGFAAQESTPATGTALCFPAGEGALHPAQLPGSRWVNQDIFHQFKPTDTTRTLWGATSQVQLRANSSRAPMRSPKLQTSIQAGWRVSSRSSSSSSSSHSTSPLMEPLHCKHRHTTSRPHLLTASSVPGNSS